MESDNLLISLFWINIGGAPRRPKIVLRRGIIALIRCKVMVTNIQARSAQTTLTARFGIVRSRRT